MKSQDDIALICKTILFELKITSIGCKATGLHISTGKTSIVAFIRKLKVGQLKALDYMV